MKSPIMPVVAQVLVLGLLGGGLTACSQSPQPEATPPTSLTMAPNPDCAQISDPVEFVNHENDEPLIGIPVPANWQRITDEDSDMVRYSAAHRRSDTDYDSVVVTLTYLNEPFTPEAAGLPELADPIEWTKDDMGNTCGYESQRIDYPVEFEGTWAKASTLLITVPYKDQTLGVAVTVQSTKAEDPTYQEAVDSIFSNIQIGKAEA